MLGSIERDDLYLLRIGKGRQRYVLDGIQMKFMNFCQPYHNIMITTIAKHQHIYHVDGCLQLPERNWYRNESGTEIHYKHCPAI